MKRFALAIALACVLSGTVLAGDSPTTGLPVPASTGETQGPGITMTVILAILSTIR